VSRLRLLVLGTVFAGALSACAAILGIEDGVPRSDAGVPDAAPVDATPPTDAKPDAAPTTCDPAKPFGAPTPLTALNAPGVEDSHGRLTPDELTIFFSSLRAGGAGGADLYTASRTRRTDPFGAPANLGAPINAPSGELMPSVTGDGLTLYFVSDRAFGSHVWFATRPSVASPFTAPQVAVGLNAAALDLTPYVLPDNATIVFDSTRLGDAGLFDLFSANAIDGGFSVPAVVKGVNTPGHDELSAAMTPDQLVIYFASNRPGTKGSYDLFVATRALPSDPFGVATPVAELNTVGNEAADWISADRCRLYFSSMKASNNGDYDLYVAEKAP